MSARDWLSGSLDHARRSLEPSTPAPRNLHRYASIPAADALSEPDADLSQLDADAELRAKLQQEQWDEPRFEAWEDRYARDVGVRREGEL